MPAAIVLVGVDAEAGRTLREGLALAGEGEVAEVETPAAALELVRADAGAVDAVLVAASVADPIALAQTLQAADPQLAVTILSDDDDHPRLSRALRFAPLVTSNTACRPRRELPSLGVELAEAARAARQRREHRQVVDVAGAGLGDAPAEERTHGLGRLVEAAPIGIVTLDASHRLAAWNRHARELLSVGEGTALGRPFAEVLDPVDPGDLLALLQSAAHARDASPSRTYRRRCAEGEQFVRLTASPFASRGGEPGIVLLAEDVTARVLAERERERIAEAQRFLAETARLLDAPLDPVETLRRIALLAVPDRAELCVIDVLREDGSIHGVAVAAVDEEVARALGEIRRLYPIDPAGEHPVARVLRSGRSEVLEELTDSTYSQIAQSPEHLALMRRLRYHSALVAPLAARGRTHGAISLLYLDPSRRYGGADLEVLEEVSRRAALALDNARLYEREHRIAETLQRSLLPTSLPRVPGLDLVARYQPGHGDVGGDWYDVIAFPDGRIACVVGDIVGRGLEAASTMGQLRNAVRVYALERVEPAAVVEAVDGLLAALGVDEMATLVYLVVDPDAGTVTFASAGHPPPLVLEPGGRARLLMSGRSAPLGVHFGGTHPEATEELEAGSLLVVYTDGLVERRGEVIDEGLARLERVAVEGPPGLDDLADHLLEQLLPGGGSDDVALLLVRFEPVGERLWLEVPAEPGNVAGVRRQLRRWLERREVPPADAYDVLIACGEACANAAEHAYGVSTGTLEVEALRDGDDLTLVVRDAGRWRSTPPEGRGLGLPLMHEAMDDVDVSTSAAGTEVRMRRRLRTPARA